MLILRQACALSPEKKGKKTFDVKVNEALCLGDACGCNRLCTRIFRCPALTWDRTKKKAVVDEVICAGCGVCASICPQKAIIKTGGQPAEMKKRIPCRNKECDSHRRRRPG